MGGAVERFMNVGSTYIKYRKRKRIFKKGGGGARWRGSSAVEGDISLDCWKAVSFSEKRGSKRQMKRLMNIKNTYMGRRKRLINKIEQYEGAGELHWVAKSENKRELERCMDKQYIPDIKKEKENNI